jgi:hypothetical protein
MNSQLTQIAHSTRIEDFRRDAARLDRRGGVAALSPRTTRRLAGLLGRRRERTPARAATTTA